MSVQKNLTKTAKNSLISWFRFSKMAIKLSVAEMVVPIDLKVHEGATHIIQGSRFLVQDNSFIAFF